MKEIPGPAVVLIGALLVPLAATAATVTTSVWTQFTTTVTQPESMNLGGAIHVVTQITSPGDPCQPTDPCRAVPATAHLNLAGVTGIGQSTGARYRATGAADATGTINMPGGFVVSAGFQLVPPNPHNFGASQLRHRRVSEHCLRARLHRRDRRSAPVQPRARVRRNPEHLSDNAVEVR